MSQPTYESTNVNNWLKISYNRIFLCVLFLLVIMNVLATISENETLLQLSKPLFIPVFLMYYLLKNKFIRSIFVVCLFFSFLGDFTSVNLSNTLWIKLSSLFYCLSYLCLVYAAISRLKRLKFDAVIGACLVIVFLINAYLMYGLFSILKTQIPDTLEMALFSIKSVALLILVFVALMAYLNTDSKESILFLVTALCFVFADVLYYISNYYLYDWSFAMLDRLLHVFGLFFLFNYIIDRNRKRKKQMVTERLENSENVLV